MIIDLIENKLGQSNLACDVCIVGAGPSGISLALELSQLCPDWNIVLLEAGGTSNATEQERGSYKVDLGDKSYSVLDISRRRKLGGTTAHWGGWSKPLDDTDYEDNQAWSVPSWPINGNDLSPFMSKAHRLCEIESQDYNTKDIHERYKASLLPFRKASKITESIFRFSPPTRFGGKYESVLKATKNIHCFLHANVYQINNKNDRIESIKARSFNGTPIKVEAKKFVFAMGGMETTRYLLNLRGNKSADGVGIRSPHLGKYFADHFGLRPGVLLAPEKLRYHQFTDDSGSIMPVLKFSSDYIRGAGEHNSCLVLSATPDDKSLLSGYGSLGLNSGKYWHYNAQIIIEPEPNPKSTLTLVDDRCELGLQRLKLSWQPHENDFKSAYRLFDIIGQELSQTSLGRLQLTNPNSESVRSNVTGSCHHLGTVRMAANSADGVVDKNCKVFGSSNLYVASSAVFPRYGYSNPTLTLVALALRLAKHLSQEYKGSL